MSRDYEILKEISINEKFWVQNSHNPYQIQFNYIYEIIIIF